MRSIPAPAGEPTLDNHSRCRSTVYPRACGGTDAGEGLAYAIGGLSPRLRGNQLSRVDRAHLLGSIPAPAGEPGFSNRLLPAVEVYPRACGGTFENRDTTRPPAGLSPRLRGNLHDTLRLKKTLGSIPAPAGEPARYRRSGRRVAVYPRACGGTPGPGLRPFPPGGLSPRLRGNHADANGSGDPQRSIPAPAGEPVQLLAALNPCRGACGGTRPALSPPCGGTLIRVGSIPAPAGEPPGHHR